MTNLVIFRATQVILNTNPVIFRTNPITTVFPLKITGYILKKIPGFVSNMNGLVQFNSKSLAQICSALDFTSSREGEEVFAQYSLTSFFLFFFSYQSLQIEV